MMTRLLVFTIDIVKQNKLANVRSPKRGDVVRAYQDGADVGTEPVRLPMFRVIDVIGMTMPEGEIYTFGEDHQLGVDIEITVRKCEWGLNLDALEAAEQTRLGRQLRDNESIETNRAAFLANIVKKERETDPEIIRV